MSHYHMPANVPTYLVPVRKFFRSTIYHLSLSHNLIHSSMYKNLRTNLPKEVMAFPDFPFDDSECGKRSFIGRLGGDVDKLGDYLSADCAKIPCISAG